MFFKDLPSASSWRTSRSLPERNMVPEGSTCPSLYTRASTTRFDILGLRYILSSVAVLMASTSSLKALCFKIYPVAPALNISAIKCLSEWTERAITLISGCSFFIRLVASIPFSPGIVTSITTISGLNCSERSTAASPFSASATISIPGSFSRRLQRPSLTISWSSAIINLRLIFHLRQINRLYNTPKRPKTIDPRQTGFIFKV